MTRLRMAFPRFLPMFIWLFLFACVTGRRIPTAAQNADGSPEIIYSEEEYLELTGDSSEEEYIPDMEIRPGSDAITADGEETTFSSEFDVSKQEAEKILQSEESLTDYLESRKEEAYEVVPDSEGNVEVSAPFQTGRLLVDRILPASYGASTVYVDRDENESILIFDTPLEAKKAAGRINRKYGQVARPDLIFSVLGKEPSASGSGMSGVSPGGPVSWGAGYMGLDKLVGGNPEALGKRKVTVAIIDSGFNRSSFLLKGKKISRKSHSFYGKSNNVKDQAGHGSHVTGIVASCSPDNVELMILKVTNPRGKAPLSYLRAAFRYAVKNGADVINLSMGIEAEYAWKINDLNSIIDKAYRKGIPVVVAAGNEDESVKHCYPACYERCITVAALNTRHRQAWYSNFGSKVDFAAPGSKILSSARSGKRDLVMMDGTSMAAPHVTAAAAIIKVMQPSLSSYGVEKELRSLSKDLGAKGKDKKYGYGVPKVGNLYKRGIRNSRYKIVGKLGTQKIKKLKNRARGILLTWRKVSRAEGYLIYRKTENGSWKKIKYVRGATNTSWIDRKVKAGRLYRYKTVTYRLGYKGAESEYRSIYRLKRPKIHAKKAGARKCRVGWKKTGKVSGYQVKYGVGSSFRNARKINVSPEKRSLVLKGLKRQTLYSFAVRSFRKKGKIRSWSAWSEARQINLP